MITENLLMQFTLSSWGLEKPLAQKIKDARLEKYYRV